MNVYVKKNTLTVLLSLSLSLSRYYMIAFVQREGFSLHYNRKNNNNNNNKKDAKQLHKQINKKSDIYNTSKKFLQQHQTYHRQFACFSPPFHKSYTLNITRLYYSQSSMFIILKLKVWCIFFCGCLDVGGSL